MPLSRLRLASSCVSSIPTSITTAPCAERLLFLRPPFSSSPSSSCISHTSSTSTSSSVLHQLRQARARSRILPHQHRVLRTSSSALSARSSLPNSASHRSSLPSIRQKPLSAQARMFGAHSHVHGHGGHSHAHGHGHSHDNTYLTSANKSDPGVRITRIGLFVNLGMAVCKGAGGVVFHSQALLADALHALTDLLSDITTLATISYSLRSATPGFPMGYGKIESIGALTVSGILLAGGLGIGLQAVLALSQQFFPEIFGVLSHVLENVPLHSHSHGGHDHGGHDHGVHVGPSIHAAWLAAGSIVVKEWLYRATMKVAKEKRSSVLSSNAYHHRVDSLTAFVALFTIVASNFLTAARWLDPVGGLVISGMIVQAGWANTKAAVLELADASVDAEVRESAHAAAVEFMTAYPGTSVRAVQGTKSGQNLMFDVEVSVPQDWSVAQCNALENELRAAIATQVRGTKRVVLRFSTTEEDVFPQEFIAPPSENSDPEANEAHTCDHEHDHEHEHEHKHGHSSGHEANGTAAQKRK